jgi:hypothetical protein
MSVSNRRMTRTYARSRPPASVRRARCGFG